MLQWPDNALLKRVSAGVFTHLGHDTHGDQDWKDFYSAILPKKETISWGDLMDELATKHQALFAKKTFNDTMLHIAGMDEVKAAVTAKLAQITPPSTIACNE